MHGEIDAEALFGPIDEFLAKGGADVGVREDLAVAHDRRHAENAQRLAARFDADDRFAGLDRLHHRVAAPRDVVAEKLRCMNAIEDERRRRLESDQRDTLRDQRLHRAAKQRRQPVAIALGDGIRDRGQRGNHGADRERGASLIVDRRDDAVILQLELLVQREPHQGALLNDRKRAENGAGRRHGQRDGKDQAGRDRSKFEHGGIPKLREREIRRIPEIP